MSTLIILFLASLARAQTPERPVRAVTDPGVITTRQAITPAGVPAVFAGRVYAVDFGRDASELWVLGATSIYRLDWLANRVIEHAPHGGSPGLQALRYDRASGRALAASTVRQNQRVQFGAVEGGRHLVWNAELGRQISGAIDVSSVLRTDGVRVAVVALVYDNALAVLDAANGKLLGMVKTGIAPVGVAVNRAGTVAWVSNWGGPIPRQGELAAATGYDPKADRVVVDRRGIAARGTVQRVDLLKMEVTHTLDVDPHPVALAWDEARQRLWVASNNRDSIAVVDTSANRLLRTFALQPFQEKVAGLAPTALALHPSGGQLLVACGGINAVAVVELPSGRFQGLIPSAWYPNAVAVSPDGKRLAISSLLGVGSGWREAPQKRFVHAYRGAVNVVDWPDAAQLASYTTAVAENNRLTLGPPQPPPRPDPKAGSVPIPRRAGEPSLIEHVVFIIKENRTYDQLFGDLPEGNGDPTLVMFGEDVTPNHRRLARQFVLLDNFYATGGNSADGHQWVTQAAENAYVMWPGYTGRSYPFDGSDPLSIADSGFLWDAAAERGRTVRIYGEYAGLTRTPMSQRQALLERWRQGDSFANAWSVSAPIASMNKHLARNYPAYSTAIPDVVRARIFLSDVRRWESEGRMPNLVLVQLPSDHTAGTTPGVSTPKAMVADNDLALGQIVEGLTHTRFWKKMAIFVVEDDAQNGVDHVDGHRTIALVISPYARRKHVDSTFYAHQSILKTIELILGIPTLTLFDLIANDMRASFTNAPDLTPYVAVNPQQSLFEQNPPLKALRGAARRAAEASQRMKWHLPDAAPTERLNRVLWGAVRGWRTPYPGVRQAVFAPLSLDIDDDDR